MKKLLLFSTLLILSAFSVNLLAVEAPKPPLNFTVTLLPANDEGFPVEFKWTRDTSGTQPDYFVIYYAPKFTNDTSAFKKLKIIEIEDKQDTFSFKKFVGPGEYTFYVISVKKGENNQLLFSNWSNLVQIKVEPDEKPFIKIVSEPKDDGQLKVGVHWFYRLKVHTNILTGINYRFDGPVPAGMTIVSDSGIVRWTPADTMSVSVKIIAFSVADTSVRDTQTIILKVVNQINDTHTLCASLNGFVKYEDSTIVKDGKVILWFIDKSDSLKQNGKDDDNDHDGDNQGEDHDKDNQGEDHDYDLHKFTSKIDSTGHFSIKVPQGSYILQVMGESFYMEFYENAKEIDSAKVINVKCGDSLIIDLFVGKKVTPHKFNVSGRVTDKSGKTGIYSIVDFIVDQKNNYKDDEDENDKKVFRAVTDQDGNYSIGLLDTYVYVAHARPKEKGSMFHDQYYDTVSTYAEATKLKLTGDLKDINFFLPNIEEGPKGKLSGKVIDSGNVGIQSQVIAYLVDNDFKKEKNFVYKVSVMTDSVGNFVLDNLFYGEYIIQSIPADEKYYPGYYLLNDFVVKKWKNGTTVSIAAADNGPITIKHMIKSDEDGVNMLFGNIKKDKNNFLYAPDEFINGSIIYAYQGNKVIDVAFSDVNGNFVLSALPEGTTYYIVDKVGYQPSIGSISLNYLTKRVETINVTMQPEIVTDVNVLSPNNAVVIYPNPATDIVNVNVANVKNISVTNLVGVSVPVNYLTSSDGIRFNVSNLPQGIYILRIESDTGVTNHTFVIQR